VIHYTIKAHPTKYSGTLFRSRLKARWAAFFDLAELRWQYEPVDLVGWVPDFWLSLPCGHSECGASHELYVEVNPALTIDELHEMTPKAVFHGAHQIPSTAMFGVGPRVTEWEMCHGFGGGIFGVEYFLGDVDVDNFWAQAGNITRWQP
jgi:hypothetical protein